MFLGLYIGNFIEFRKLHVRVEGERMLSAQEASSAT